MLGAIRDWLYLVVFVSSARMVVAGGDPGGWRSPGGRNEKPGAILDQVPGLLPVFQTGFLITSKIQSNRELFGTALLVLHAGVIPGTFG